MYLEHFGLRDFPFRLTPDTDFLYWSPAHVRAKSYMDYALQNPEGFVAITGEIGCGKTTLAQKLVSELDSARMQVARLFQTQLDDVEFLQAVLVEFGLKPFGMCKVELIDTLNTFLVDNYTQCRPLVLVVDDAHNLTLKALEEMRMLSGLETRKERLLHIILLGQPQLNDLLDAPELEQLRQRVRLRYHIKPFSEAQIADYIAHRLRVAGCETTLFAPEVMPTVYRYTGGVPRLINSFCDMALTCAYADNADGVTDAVVRDTVAELGWPTRTGQAAARNGGKNRRRLSVEPAGRDGERALLHLDGRLNRIEALAPVLETMADRIGNIETALRGDMLDAVPPRKVAAGNKRNDKSS